MRSIAIIGFAAAILTLPRPGRAEDETASETNDDPSLDSGSDWRAEPPPPVPQARAPAEMPDAVSPAMTPPATAPSEADFSAALDAHGTWVEVPGLGRVWRPASEAVGEDFVPYMTNGRWVSAADGWEFQSGWPWGWATFHYGRWYLDSTFGWVWWPDYAWGPAWVDWRYSGGYVAWAPLPPLGFALDFAVGVPGWCFVSYGLFYRPWVERYVIYPRTGGRDGDWGYHRGTGWSRHHDDWDGRRYGYASAASSRGSPTPIPRSRGGAMPSGRPGAVGRGYARDSRPDGHPGRAPGPVWHDADPGFRGQAPPPTNVRPATPAPARRAVAPRGGRGRPHRR